MKRSIIISILFWLISLNNSFANELTSDWDIYLSHIKPHLKHIKTIKDWEIYEREHKSKVTCHAATFPYRTRAFEGIRDMPYLMVTYKGPMQYSITVNPGFIVDRRDGLILNVNGKSHVLSTKFPRIALTESSTQDASIINDIIKEEKIVSIRSYTINKETSLDYYSTKGFVEALRYMESNCGNFSPVAATAH